MSQCYSVIIDYGISERVHRKEVVDGLNAIKIAINTNSCIMFNCQDQFFKLTDSNELLHTKQRYQSG